MNCLEYVESRLDKKTYEALEDILVSREFFMDKSVLNVGDKIVFAHRYHVGFAELGEFYELVTDECSDDTILSRVLSLYDDALKIILINPKIKERSKK